jgi:hypothetical protein
MQFVRELSWTLSTYSDLDFKALGELSERLEFRNQPTFLSRLTERPSSIAALVGCLPDLFTDETLFPSNEDIADFAESALGVFIPRWSKKSKYEIIGHIVCHTSVAEKARLERVVEAMTRITENREAASAMINDNKSRGMTWNELIQRLNEER